MAYNGYPSWTEYQAALKARMAAYAAEKPSPKVTTQSGVSRTTAKSSAKEG